MMWVKSFSDSPPHNLSRCPHPWHSIVILDELLTELSEIMLEQGDGVVAKLHIHIRIGEILLQVLDLVLRIVEVLLQVLNLILRIADVLRHVLDLVLRILELNLRVGMILSLSLEVIVGLIELSLDLDCSSIAKIRTHDSVRTLVETIIRRLKSCKQEQHRFKQSQPQHRKTGCRCEVRLNKIPLSILLSRAAGAKNPLPHIPDQQIDVRSEHAVPLFDVVLLQEASTCRRYMHVIQDLDVMSGHVRTLAVLQLVVR